MEERYIVATGIVEEGLLLLYTVPSHLNLANPAIRIIFASLAVDTTWASCLF